MDVLQVLSEPGDPKATCKMVATEGKLQPHVDSDPEVFLLIVVFSYTTRDLFSANTVPQPHISRCV